MSSNQTINLNSKLRMTTTRSKKEKFDPKDHIRDGFTEDEIECIKEAFDLFDSNGNGTIDMSEFKNAMSTLGYEGRDEVVF